MEIQKWTMPWFLLESTLRYTCINLFEGYFSVFLLSYFSVEHYMKLASFPLGRRSNSKRWNNQRMWCKNSWYNQEMANRKFLGRRSKWKRVYQYDDWMVRRSYFKTIPYLFAYNNDDSSLVTIIRWTLNFLFSGFMNSYSKSLLTKNSALRRF